MLSRWVSLRRHVAAARREHGVARAGGSDTHLLF
jgi:hypothetical protein